MFATLSIRDILSASVSDKDMIRLLADPATPDDLAEQLLPGAIEQLHGGDILQLSRISRVRRSPAAALLLPKLVKLALSGGSLSSGTLGGFVEEANITSADLDVFHEAAKKSLRSQGSRKVAAEIGRAIAGREDYALFVADFEALLSDVLNSTIARDPKQRAILRFLPLLSADGLRCVFSQVQDECIAAALFETPGFDWRSYREMIAECGSFQVMQAAVDRSPAGDPLFGLLYEGLRARKLPLLWYEKGTSGFLFASDPASVRLLIQEDRQMELLYAWGSANFAAELTEEALPLVASLLHTVEAPVAVCKRFIERAGDERAADLIRGRVFEENACMFGRLWSAKTPLLLDALLDYPIASVRAAVATAGEQVPADDDATRTVLRETVLPRLLMDKSKVVREKAKVLAAALGASTAETMRAAFGGLAEAMSEAETLTLQPAVFDALLARATTSPKVTEQRGILGKLSKRSDLDASQYERLIALGRDDVTLALASAIPPKFIHLLLRIRGRDAHTDQALARRADLWGHDETEYFVRHSDRAVRSTVLQQSAILTPAQVLHLLAHAATPEEMSALAQNREWRSRYAPMLKKLAESEARRP